MKLLLPVAGAFASALAAAAVAMTPPAETEIMVRVTVDDAVLDNAAVRLTRGETVSTGSTHSAAYANGCTETGTSREARTAMIDTGYDLALTDLGEDRHGRPLVAIRFDYRGEVARRMRAGGRCAVEAPRVAVREMIQTLPIPAGAGVTLDVPGDRTDKRDVRLHLTRGAPGETKA